MCAMRHTEPSLQPHYNRNVSAQPRNISDDLERSRMNDLHVGASGRGKVDENPQDKHHTAGKAHGIVVFAAIFTGVPAWMLHRST
mmetsp:Transcript_42723/g.106737  ORF Transcript_42723/g.106737 Transcript_42723/m.106737 type:complete len:85 (-) Transcript_42723:53-307(-)